MIPADARRSLLLYNLVFPFLLLAMLPSMLMRMVRRGNFRNKFAQRFGTYDATVRDRFSKGKWVWIQSISVGETMIALKLAHAMRARDPDLNVALSVTTSTGFAVASEQTPPWIEPIYTPIDFLPFVRRALAVIRPTQLIVIEGMWPNLAAEARQRGAQLDLIGRLSPRSERRYRKFEWLAGPGFRLFDRICVWDEHDRKRWLSIGVRAGQLHVTGGIKFDMAGGADRPSREADFRELLQTAGIAPDRPILLGGSTFPGEEAILARTLKSLRKEIPDLFLIAVPRHAERAHEAAQDFTKEGVRFFLRTEGPNAGAAYDALIVNTTGELRDWYRLASVVFVGKSLTAVGGQNPGEPAAAGKPLLFGPNMQNFEAVVKLLLEKNAAIQVPDEAALIQVLRELLRDTGRHDQMALAAKEAMEPHQGATVRTAELLTARNG